MKIIKIIWALSLPLVPIVMKFHLLGDSNKAYLVGIEILFVLLLGVWQETIRKLILKEYPDVVEKNPTVKSFWTTWSTMQVGRNMGDERLRREVNLHRCAIFLTFIFWAVCYFIFSRT